MGGTVTFSGCTGIPSLGSQKDNSRPVATVRIPETPAKYTYALIGSGNRPTVTYYGNWKSSDCARFSDGFLKDITNNYVTTGEITIQFRGLAYINGHPLLGPDALRAARAGLIVWNIDPSTYWKYYEHVMSHQPSEQKQWATVEKLVSLAKEADVSNIGTLHERLTTSASASAIQATTEAANKSGVSRTPTLVVGSETVNPLIEQKRTRLLLDKFTRKQ